jgi:hypothetical protein
MTHIRSLTSQEIDDGWCLDDDPYLEFVIEQAPSSAFEQAFWEQHEGKKLTRRFGETSSDFGKGFRVRGTLAPHADPGN